MNDQNQEEPSSKLTAEIPNNDIGDEDDIFFRLMAAAIKAAIKDLYDSINTLTGALILRKVSAFDANSAAQFLFSNTYILRRFGDKRACELLQCCLDVDYLRKKVYDAFKTGMQLTGVGINEPLNEKGWNMFLNILEEIEINDRMLLSDKVLYRFSA